MNRHCRTLLIFFAILLVGVTLPVDSRAAKDVESLSSSIVACGVSEDVVNRVLAAGLDGTFDRSQIVSMFSVLQQVCEQKLPTGAFEGKIQEGLAKHVPGSRITLFLNKMLDDYLFARGVFTASASDSPTQKQIATVSETLVSGLPRSVFTRYFSKFSPKPAYDLSLGLEVVSYLSLVDFPADLSLKIVQAGYRAGSLDSQWRFLSRVVPLARKRGVSDNEVAAAAVDALNDGKGVRAVLESLEFTSRSVLDPE